MSNSPLKVIVVGASGFLGSRVYLEFSKSYTVVGTFNRTRLGSELLFLDAANIDQVRDFFSSYKPDVVINCSGLTNLDQCEMYPEKSWVLNSRIPVNLSIVAKEFGALFIHVSTDNFLVPEHSVRDELAQVSAINVYGLHKIMAENFIQNISGDHIILRTNFFGIGSRTSPNFLEWIVDSALASREIVAFNDVFFTPVSLEFLICTIEMLIDEGFRGLMNIGASETLSKYDFIMKVFDSLAGDSGLVSSGSITQSCLIALRPRDMSLDSTKLSKLFGKSVPSIDQMINSELSRLR